MSILVLSNMMCYMNALFDHNIKVEKINEMNQAAFRSLETIFHVMTSSNPDSQNRMKSTRFAYAYLTHQISDMKSSFASSVSLLFFYFYIYLIYDILVSTSRIFCPI